MSDEENDTPTPEVVYHTMAGQDADLAAKDKVLFRWNGSFWAAQDLADEESRAFAWLKRGYETKATPRLAISCVSAAIMGAQPLPGADSNAVVLPLKNGYLRIDTESGELALTDPDKGAGLTYLIDAHFDPVADAPLFNKFLEEVLPDRETREWVQEFAGYTLLSDCRFQTAVFFVGSGANGKTTLAEIVSALHRRVVSMQLNALSGFKLSPLLDASLVIVDETPARIDEQALKSLVSGGLCQVDRKYRDPISFHPTAKWVILGNAMPAVSDQSHGFWRRMPVVPFGRQFDPEEQDPALVHKITSRELSGVLSWAVAGLVRLVRRGQLPPQSEAMLKAQGEGQKESNSVLAWWRDDRAEIDADFETPRQAVYSDYKIWCTENGMSPLGVERFWNRLRVLAGAEAVEATVRKIDGQATRVVPLRLLAGPTRSTQKKVVNGRW